ncbi:molecular chaperone [Mycobacterium rhizamassiliense]|uniref:Molecular chaperone n=1 Tax=Mycobacterium rhizamassiliense TaxID=1841860 RepID=A0A2U3NNV3_9MYCO|nr:Hsp70 family protein [Mycobacterium rhizamassiliense]SPM33218.1 molecular chaperone [Mycobacterium rhizamassiliense]
MSESLGLSIGVATLVAARAGGDPVARRSVLTLFDQQPSEVGLPEEHSNPAGAGLVIRGFVERVGDRTPLVASDGTKYLGDALTVEALEVMARSVGYGTPITIAVPAYWSDGQSEALREEFFAQPGLTSDGAPPTLISDATAALAALRGEPEFPADGVVALCDFGAGGTTVTLANAGPDQAQIGASVRYAEFSGDAIDQLVLNHVRDNGSNPDTTGGLASTTRMGSLARRLEQCRHAKEQLSTAEVATVAGGTREDVELSRNEFEGLIAEPVDGLIATIQEILQRNDIATESLAAVAAVGGGASIPLLVARLSERLGVRVHTAAAPALSAAAGAALLGELRPPAPPEAGAALDNPTQMAAAVLDNPTQMAAAAPLDMTQAIPGARIEEDHPLAWSEDPDADEPVPYTGPEHSGQYAREAMDFDDPEDNRYAAEVGRLPWYKRTALIVSVVSAGVALLLLGVVLALTLDRPETVPVPPPTQSTSAPTPTPSPQTVTVTDTPTETSTPAPPPTTTEPPVTTAPPVTTTEAPITPTTTVPPVITTEPPPTRERPRLFPRWR